MPHYKHGKIQESLSFQEIQEKVTAAQKKVTKEQLSFFWLLYYSGCRKSELYERTAEDCQLKENFFIIDFHQRKKHGAEVPPLKFPLWFPGINIVCEQLRKSRKRKPSKKLIERFRKQERSTERVKARWLFPNIHRTQAGRIVKKILGSNYYPHFLRLNRITEMCADPQLSLSRLKSFTGIKSLDALQSYLGVAEREQDAAVDFMAKQIKESHQELSDQKCQEEKEEKSAWKQGENPHTPENTETGVKRE